MDPNPQDFPESWRGGAGNFWNLRLPAKSTDYEMHECYRLIIDLVKGSHEKVTIIAMAAMTDVALALKNDPGIIDNIAHIVIMGGAFTVPGNLNDAPDPTSNITAEWNMYIDAEATKYIFDFGVPVSIVPLDAIQYLVTDNDIKKIDKIKGPQVNFVEEIWHAQMSWFAEFLIWDTITAVAVTNPELFEWIMDGVDVITEPGDFQGRTVPLNNGAQHIRYSPSADYAATMDLFYETYSGNPDYVPKMRDEAFSELGGRWEGDTSNFHIIFNLAPDCMLGVICDTFEITDFSLAGDITVVDVEGNVYEFRASNLSSGLHSEAVYEYLQKLPDGTLKYYSQGKEGSTEAILYKN